MRTLLAKVCFALSESLFLRSKRLAQRATVYPAQVGRFLSHNGVVYIVTEIGPRGGIVGRSLDTVYDGFRHHWNLVRIRTSKPHGAAPSVATPSLVDQVRVKVEGKFPDEPSDKPMTATEVQERQASGPAIERGEI